MERGEPLFTTRFNVAELYVGIARSSSISREQKVVDKLLENIVILEFDERATWLFGHITAHLMNIGKPAGDMDVLIGATALAAQQPLITRNKSHFSNIPQLQVEDY